MNNDAVIRLEGVHKRYTLGKTTVPALAGIDLEVKASEFLVIAGSSGSGKTTLLNLMGLIDMPSQGAIWLGEEAVQRNGRAMSQYRRDRLGFIFQTFNLVPVMNVYENVEYPLILQNLPRRQRKARVMETLTQVGLADRHRHKPRELSGGQRQRVAIARAMVKRPDIVLADEPTANLDSRTGEEIVSLMETLNRDQSTTFVFSSHDPLVIAKGQRVLHLKDGRITTEEIRS